MSESAEPVATVVNGHTFTIDTRYVLKDSRILGKGSFGVVCTAYDSIRKINIAIKRIRPYANDEWDARHTLREIRLLKLLGPHPNIVSLYELSLFEPKTELYMMMELMDCDLHRVIQSKQPLSEKHHKCFIKQILEAIKAMHSIGVFHRDLKPGNILVSKDCQVRITDFGLARFMDESTRSGQNDLNPMTEYVVTRWYRCPELLLSPNRPYSEAIDLWSVGCILAELIKRKPLFPGKSHAHQVQLVFEVVGYANSAELGFPVSSEALSFLEKRCRYRKQPLSKFIPEASPQALEMLQALLAVNPQNRPSAAQAMAFSFLDDAEILNDYSPNYLTRPSVDYFDFEHERYTVSQLKDMIDNEVFTAAADAYRKSNRLSNPPNNEKGSAAVLARNNQHQISSHNLGGYDESDGPVSQLTTQVRNTRLTSRDNEEGSNQSSHVHAARPVKESSDNPFRSQPATNNNYQNSSRNDADSINNQNILTAVRNDLIGTANPAVVQSLRTARKSAPKTPSPQKMDIILQKDAMNKQKAMKEQAEDDAALSARSEATQSSESESGRSQYTGKYYANIFAKRTAPSNNTNGVRDNNPTNNVGAANNPSNKRFGRLMSAFPSLPGGSNRPPHVPAAAAPLNNLYKSSSNSEAVAAQLNNVNTRASIAMMNSGSNILHHEYDYTKY